MSSQCFLNRPGEQGWAVLQLFYIQTSLSLIHSWSHHLRKYLHNTLTPKLYELGSWHIERKFTSASCHTPDSLFTSFRRIGEASRWSVCYQWGYPVFNSAGRIESATLLLHHYGPPMDFRVHHHKDYIHIYNILCKLSLSNSSVYCQTPWPGLTPPWGGGLLDAEQQINFYCKCQVSRKINLIN